MRESAFAALNRCFESSHRRKYAKNSTIINAGDYSNSLYYIISGSVSVILEDQDGHEMILAYLNKGEFFGELGLFDERHERSAWVRARSASEIAQLSYERLEDLSKNDPEVIFSLLMIMSLRIRDTSRKLVDLAFRDVAGRIARALLDLCKQPDAKKTARGTAIRITRQELGRIVGCSREMASRVLRNMEEHGIVSVDGKTVTVHHRPEAALEGLRD